MSNRDFNGAAYPLLASQMLNNSGHRQGEPTGQVFCPLRWSHIAVMRCGEYQERDGCAAGCACAASPEDIAAARGAVSKVDERSGLGSYVCVECGGGKNSLYSPCCASCGRTKGQRFRRRGRDV